jgi:Domain of unknown function DUF83
MDIIKTLTTALKEADNQRARSTQVELGASSVGGCRAQAWHIINQTPKINEGTESLAAILGTAIHNTVQEALQSYDLFGEDYLLEQGFETPELKGHCDFYSRKDKLVVDWKTTSLKNLPKFPSAQQKMQVQLYGYLLTKNGLEVETVALCAIPRDGRMRDIKVWQAPYDESVALEGLQWIAEIKAMESAPPPERSAAFFCRDFCSYYDPSGKIGCTGK